MKDKKSLIVFTLILLSLFFIAFKIGTFDKKVKKLNDSQTKTAGDLGNKITNIEKGNTDLKDKVEKLLEHKENTTNFEKLYNFEVVNFDKKEVEVKLTLLPKLINDNMEVEIFNDKNNSYKLDRKNTFFEKTIKTNLDDNIPLYVNVRGLNASFDESNQKLVENNSTSRIFKLSPSFESNIQANETKYGDIVFDKLFYVYDKKIVTVKPKKITYNYDYRIKKFDKFRKSNFVNHTLFIEKNGKLIEEINLVEKNLVSENRFLIEGEVEATIKDKVNFIIKSKNEANDEYITYLTKIENGINTISGDTKIDILNNGIVVYTYMNSIYEK